jgi:hypothetical protein
MKMILTPATTPDGYIACLTGWQQGFAVALRNTVRTAAPELEERLKWGHLVYVNTGPVLIIRAEPTRVLFGFMRGQRLRHIEPRLKPGGQYELATLELRQDTPLLQQTVVDLVLEAARLNLTWGDPTQDAKSGPARAGTPAAPPAVATPPQDSASARITARIADLADWRGDMLGRIRALIHAADPAVVEEWKWRGTPVWSHSGLICTGETYKSVVKMTFAKGASLPDPAGLFNASLDGHVRRAIDIRQGEQLDEPAMKALIQAAVDLNTASALQRRKAP